MACPEKLTTGAIPAVDLSPFFQDGDGDEDGRKKAIDTIAHACKTYGFFRITNHGVSPDLMARAIELSREFFATPDHKKLEASPVVGSESPMPAGYARQPAGSADKNEYLMMFDPSLGINVYPSEPSELRAVLEEFYGKLCRTTSMLVEEALNQCMGLPRGFLKGYNSNRAFDMLTAMHYFPATRDESNGIAPHEDANFLTLLVQDEVGGLEVLKDGEWIPVDPEPAGSIAVNVGDIIQVLSNDKLKSATHRVVRKGRDRYSFAFFFNLDGEKWVEPLPQFAGEAAARYRGFQYKDYLQLRIRNKTHPPSRPEDVVHITKYAT